LNCAKFMKILITTPSGIIGRRILPELLAPEFSVRVITRHPDQLPSDIREQVEIVRGSTDDVNALREALEGVDALFWCVPFESLHETHVRGHYERFARAASQAILEGRTPRVVNISAIGVIGARAVPARSTVELPLGVEQFPDLGGHFYRCEPGTARAPGKNPSVQAATCVSPASALRTTEEILNGSGAAIRHLRCSWPSEDSSQLSSTHNHGITSHPIPGKTRIPIAAAADIADIALKLLVRRDWSGIQALSVSSRHTREFVEVAESGCGGTYSQGPEIFEKSPDIGLSVA
jgi:uncharacterized protein YbjT (DUF2867 family)